MSNTTNTMSAAAVRDLSNVIARWTGDNIDVTKSLRAETKDFRLHAEKDFARTVGAAYATHYAYAADMVGKGKKWENSQALATDGFGLASKGNITKYRALGRLLVVAGMAADSADYARIQKGMLQTRENLKALIAGEDSALTLDAVLVALAADDKAAEKKKAGTPTLTADEKKAAAKAAADKIVADAMADMLPTDRVKIIGEMLRLLADDPKTLPKHLATVGADLAKAIDKHKGLVAERTAEKGKPAAA